MKKTFVLLFVCLCALSVLGCSNDVQEQQDGKISFAIDGKAIAERFGALNDSRSADSTFNAEVVVSNVSTEAVIETINQTLIPSENNLITLQPIEVDTKIKISLTISGAGNKIYANGITDEYTVKEGNQTVTINMTVLDANCPSVDVGIIVGSVSNESGTEIAANSVIVYAKAVSENGTETVACYSTLDESGEYELFVEPGTYNVVAYSPFSSGTIEQVSVSRSEEVTVGDITISVPGSITGTISITENAEDANETIDYAIEGLTAYIPGTNFSSSVKSDGSYSISYVPVGTYTLWVTNNLNYRKIATEGIVVQSNTSTAVAEIKVLESDLVVIEEPIVEEPEYPMTWIGKYSSDAEIEAPVLNWVYYNTTDKTVYIYQEIDGALAWTSCFGLAQEEKYGTISGSIYYVDSKGTKLETPTPEGVLIFIPGLSGVVITGNDGAFKFTNLAAGEYSIYYMIDSTVASLKEGAIVTAGDNNDVGSLAIVSTEGDTGEEPVNGITWKGSYESEAALLAEENVTTPVLNWVYYNTTDQKAYQYVADTDTSDTVETAGWIEFTYADTTTGLVQPIICNYYPSRLLLSETENIIYFSIDFNDILSSGTQTYTLETSEDGTHWESYLSSNIAFRELNLYEVLESVYYRAKVTNTEVGKGSASSDWYVTQFINGLNYNEGRIQSQINDIGKIIYTEAGEPYGIVFDIGLYGDEKIIALNEKNVVWSTENAETYATSASDGKANMAAIQTISGWQSKYPAFYSCAAKQDGGSGWYLPAIQECYQIAASLNKIQEALDSLNKNGHIVSDIDPGVAYLSSTQVESDSARYIIPYTWVNDSCLKKDKAFQASWIVAYEGESFEQNQVNGSLATRAIKTIKYNEIYDDDGNTLGNFCFEDSNLLTADISSEIGYLAGDTAIIEVASITNLSSLAYTWFKKEKGEWVAIPEETTSVLEIQTVISDDSLNEETQEYRCVLKGVWSDDNGNEKQYIATASTSFTVYKTVVTSSFEFEPITVEQQPSYYAYYKTPYDEIEFEFYKGEINAGEVIDCNYDIRNDYVCFQPILEAGENKYYYTIKVYGNDGGEYVYTSDTFTITYIDLSCSVLQYNSAGDAITSSGIGTYYSGIDASVVIEPSGTYGGTFSYTNLMINSDTIQNYSVENLSDYIDQNGGIGISYSMEGMTDQEYYIDCTYEYKVDDYALEYTKSYQLVAVSPISITAKEKDILSEPDATVEIGISASMDPTLDDGNVLTYQWYDGSGAIEGETNETMTVKASTDSPCYYCIVTQGAFSAQSPYINIYPIAYDLTVTPTSGTIADTTYSTTTEAGIDLTMNIADNSGMGGKFEYVWSVTDGTSGTTSSIVYAATAGTYTMSIKGIYKMTITTMNDESVSLEKTLVEKQYTVTVE